MRKITSLEVDKKLTDLQNGVYGFVNALDISSHGKFIDLSQIKTQASEVRSPYHRFCFKFEKNENGNIDLIGYVSEEFLSKNKADSIPDGLFFPYPHNEFSNLFKISLPLRLSSFVTRDIEDGKGGNITIFEFSKINKKPKNNFFKTIPKWLMAPGLLILLFLVLFFAGLLDEFNQFADSLAKVLSGL